MKYQYSVKHGDYVVSRFLNKKDAMDEAKFLNDKQYYFAYREAATCGGESSEIISYKVKKIK